MSKLLIPLDGSEFSRKVLPHVRTIFDPEKVEIKLLQVTKPVPGPSSGGFRFIAPENVAPVSPRDEEESHIAASVMANMELDERELKDAGFTVSRDVRFGPPAQKILEFVAVENVAMVAMATHGRSGLPRLLMGSVAETLLRRLAVPVLLVNPVDVASRKNPEVGEGPSV
jgi:nucleotide-binding universal stress UspA family protein